MRTRSRNALRVLLVTQSDEEVRSFGLPLHRAGIAVTRVRDVAGAVAALQAGAFDAAIVSHPLPDADVIGSCASLGQVPGAPPVILADALDPNEQTFPAAICPTRLAKKPLDAAKLAAWVRELAEEGGLDAPEPGAAPNDGPLALASALLQLAAARETGVLEVVAGSVRVRIFLREGAPVSAEGGSLRETLGRMLLRRGALAEADYVRVIERMTERTIANEHQRMGEVLVELGLLSSQEVHAALESQALEKIVACFQWPGASWSFCEIDALPEGLEPFALPPTEQLVLAGLRAAPPEALGAWLDTHGASCARLARPVAALQELLQLDAAGLRQLERVDGARTLAELGREDEAARALFATLLLIEALEPVGAGAPATARAKEARRAPFAREVVRLPKGAAQPPAAAPASPAQNRLEAEQCFRRGHELLAADQLHEAARLLQRAVELEPGEPEYAMAEAFASYLAARQGARAARARAAAAARKMLAADPKVQRAHTILGRLALDEGDRVRAAREFELALLRDPEDEDAKRGLKQARS